MRCFRLALLAVAPMFCGAAATAQQQPPGATTPAGPPAPEAAPAAAAPPPAPASGTQRISTGLLECRGAFAVGYGFGSTRRVHCEFRPTIGRNQYYAGSLERVGLDIGVSDQGSMLWVVLATSPSIGAGALSGTYVGISSGFSLGPGFSANMLASKDSAQQVTHQPLSVSSDSGLSISLTGATLTLEPSTPQDAPRPNP